MLMKGQVTHFREELKFVSVHKILTDEIGFPPEDIIFDLNVIPLLELKSTITMGLISLRQFVDQTKSSSNAIWE
jgi:cobalamin-dependent methionine synthase I